MRLKRTRTVETSFTIKYDKLRDGEHSIDVADYATSLLAMSGMLRTAGRILAPNADVGNLSLTANNEGSIDVVLEIGFVAVGLFASDPATALANASSIVSTAWGALKKLRHFGAGGDAPKTVLNIHGGVNTFNVSNDEALLIQDTAFRNHAAKTLDPLVTGSVGAMNVIERDRVIESFDRADADAVQLAVDTNKELVGDRKSLTEVVVFGASYDQHRLRVGLDEGSARWADVEDQGLIGYMDQEGASIANGTVLEVELRVQTFRTSGGRTSSKWSILRVFDQPELEIHVA